MAVRILQNLVKGTGYIPLPEKVRLIGIFCNATNFINEVRYIALGADRASLFFNGTSWMAFTPIITNPTDQIYYNVKATCALSIMYDVVEDE